jgi:CubicO group peptidase (beta-lactamase class C family)
MVAVSVSSAGSEGAVAASTSEGSVPKGTTAAIPAALEAKTIHELTAADVEAWLDGFLNYGLQSGAIAGAVIAVVKDGEVLFQSGYGYADVAKKTPMDPNRVMTRIGSTSKLFTWTAVMQLVEQGKLDLNRNVDDYLDFKVSPAGGKPITLLDLMNHRGGFEEGLKDVLALDPRQAQSTETYLKTHPRPLLFPPGTVPAYSNYGTALAGYIVERVSAEPYERYIQDHIFTPLGMRNSTFEQPLPERFSNMMSHGYRTASTPAQPYELVMTAPAGSAATTAADMARFMLAHLQQGHIGSYDMLQEPTALLMHSPSAPSLPGFAALEHGFFHEVRNGRTLIGHGGDTIFFHTEMQLLPEEGVGIFYSFNSRGRANAVYGLRKALLDQFMDRYFPDTATATEPPVLASAVNDATKIQGRYETSRRVQHGFLSIFYLLQQTVINAGPDGTIRAPRSFEPGEAVFREVAPDMWQEIGGARRLALQNVNGIQTVVDSEDPSSVLQLVPKHRSASLNLTLLLGSSATLILAVILWPVAYAVRRHYKRPLTHQADTRRFRTLLRVAATFAVAWLLCWTIVLLPVLNLQLDFYGASHDLVIGLLQFSGFIAVALTAAGLYCFWRLYRLEPSWPSRLGNGSIAAALIALIWVGCIGGLIGVNLNY